MKRLWDEKYNELSNEERLSFPLDAKLVFLSDCNYDNLFVAPLEDHGKVAPMSSLCCKKNFVCVPAMPTIEEEVKERKGLKILPPNKLLTRLQVLLAKIEAENNSCQLKTTLGRCNIFFINIIN